MNTAFGANGEATSAMNPIFGDYDNDGWQDLFVSDMRYHRLFHNPGAKGFWLDTTVETGVAAVSGQYVAWGDGFLRFRQRRLEGPLHRQRRPALADSHGRFPAPQ